MSSVPIKSLLFAPGNISELLLKAPRSGADVFVACLEDGTPPAYKIQAREISRDAFRSVKEAEFSGTMVVRINGAHTRYFPDDVQFCAASRDWYDGIVLPMVRSSAEIAQLDTVFDSATPQCSRKSLVLGIETTLGVVNLAEILRAAVAMRNFDAAAVYFGAEDFATDLGAVRTASSHEVMVARQTVVLTAHAYGIGAIDQAVVDFRDDEKFRDEATVARQLGYEGKICITPDQCALANAAFRPTSEEIKWSTRLLREYEAAEAAGRAAPEIDGIMIDGPLVVRARRILARVEPPAGPA